jgi:hypothetical protein
LDLWNFEKRYVELSKPSRTVPVYLDSFEQHPIFYHCQPRFPSPNPRVASPFTPRAHNNTHNLVIMTAQPALASPAPEPESASLAQKRKLDDIQNDAKLNGASPEKDQDASPEPTIPDSRVQRLITDVLIVLKRCDFTPSHNSNMRF